MIIPGVKEMNYWSYDDVNTYYSRLLNIINYNL